ncbi:MAG: hypothetical protein J4473_01760 [Candidatus Aenigmarchaeota archaeon]|nr:hypothetical protein [Candidatus Aenigmarchaeota archaeon]
MDLESFLRKFVDGNATKRSKIRTHLEMLEEDLYENVLRYSGGHNLLDVVYNNRRYNGHVNGSAIIGCFDEICEKYPVFVLQINPYSTEIFVGHKPAPFIFPYETDHVTFGTYSDFLDEVERIHSSDEDRQKEYLDYVIQSLEDLYQILLNGKVIDQKKD